MTNKEIIELAIKDFLVFITKDDIEFLLPKKNILEKIINDDKKLFDLQEYTNASTTGVILLMHIEEDKKKYGGYGSCEIKDEIRYLTSDRDLDLYQQNIKRMFSASELVILLNIYQSDTCESIANLELIIKILKNSTIGDEGYKEFFLNKAKQYNI